MQPTFEQAQQWTNLWMDFATKVASVGMAYRPDEQAPPEIAQHVRGATFAAMTQEADKFLRSEQFLGMIKQSLDASIGLRKQVNDLLTQVHHNVQGLARQDMDAMGVAVRHLETRVLSRIEEVCERLENLSERLDKLESHAGSNGSRTRQTQAQGTRE